MSLFSGAVYTNEIVQNYWLTEQVDDTIQELRLGNTL